MSNDAHGPQMKLLVDAQEEYEQLMQGFEVIAKHPITEMKQLPDMISRQYCFVPAKVEIEGTSYRTLRIPEDKKCITSCKISERLTLVSIFSISTTSLHSLIIQICIIRFPAYPHRLLQSSVCTVLLHFPVQVSVLCH